MPFDWGKRSFLAFATRWFSSMGFPPATASARADFAWARSKKYPSPLNLLFPFLAIAVEWMFPTLFAGIMRRASRLTDDAFRRFEKVLHTQGLRFARLGFAFIRLPLWEFLSPEEKSVATVTHPLTGHLALRPAREIYDVAVIGSGAGGAPLADELAKSGASVIVIEEGNLALPGTVADTIKNHYLKQGFLASATGGMTVVFAGSAVGGTTPINSGTCLAPTFDALQRWDELLGTDFAAGALNPYVERALDAFHVSVPPFSALGKSAELFRAGILNDGKDGAAVLPRGAKDCVGAGRCCFVCPTGVKSSTDRIFLPSAVAHGAEILAPARAVSIREGDDSVTITVANFEGRHTVTARRLVIAGGGLQTPALIRKNRLGRNWRRAGEGLRIHPATKVFAHFPHAVHGELGIPQGMGWTTPDLPRVVFEGIFTPLAAAAPLMQVTGAELKWWLDEYANIASFGFMLLERGCGRVRQVGSWPIVSYRLDPEDYRDAVAAVVTCARIFFKAGADRVLLPFAMPDNVLTTARELEKISADNIPAKRLMLSGFHPQGTAAMGSVTTTELDLIGSSRIHVCDASVLPLSPGVNPQITIMALSFRLADRLKGSGLDIGLRGLCDKSGDRRSGVAIQPGWERRAATRRPTLLLTPRGMPEKR